MNSCFIIVRVLDKFCCSIWVNGSWWASPQVYIGIIWAYLYGLAYYATPFLIRIVTAERISCFSTNIISTDCTGV